MLSMVFAAVLTTQPAYQEPSSTDAVKLRFAWPVTGSVPVREEVLKKGNRATLHYELSWRPAEGEQLIIGQEDVRLSLPGVDTSLPKVRQAVREAQAMAAVVPRMHVSQAGEVVGFEPFDETVERTAAELRDSVDEETVALMHQVVGGRDMGPLLEAKLRETWSAWVADWIGMSVVRGTQRLAPVDPERSGGVISEVQLQFTDRAEFRGVPCVEVIKNSSPDEEALKAKMVAMMNASPGSEGLAQRIERVGAIWMTRCIFSIDDLRPLEVHTSRSKLVWFRGREEPVEEREDHSYFFAWGDLAPEEESK